MHIPSISVFKATRVVDSCLFFILLLVTIGKRLWDSCSMLITSFMKLYILIIFTKLILLRTNSYYRSLSLYNFDQCTAPLIQLELKFEEILDMISIKESNSLLAKWQLPLDQMHEQNLYSRYTYQPNFRFMTCYFLRLCCKIKQLSQRP